MGLTFSAIGDYVGSFFATDAAAATTTAAAADTAATATAATATTAAAGTAAAGTAAAAVAAPAATASISTTIAEAAAVASGASALYSLAKGPGRLNVPPTPGVAQTDQTVANAEQESLRRREAAGGLQSSVGTPGGQAGSVLNPATLSNRSVLGG